MEGLTGDEGLDALDDTLSCLLCAEERREWLAEWVGEWARLMVRFLRPGKAKSGFESMVGSLRERVAGEERVRVV